MELSMPTIYDDVLKTYRIPKKYLYDILRNPLEVRKKTKKNHKGFVEILEIYQDRLLTLGTESAVNRNAKFIRELKIAKFIRELKMVQK